MAKRRNQKQRLDSEQVAEVVKQAVSMAKYLEENRERVSFSPESAKDGETYLDYGSLTAEFSPIERKHKDGSIVDYPDPAAELRGYFNTAIEFFDGLAKHSSKENFRTAAAARKEWLEGIADELSRPRESRASKLAKQTADDIQAALLGL